MKLGVQYNLRHLVQRKGTTALTVLGIALVIIVFVATLMLAVTLVALLAVDRSGRQGIMGR